MAKHSTRFCQWDATEGSINEYISSRNSFQDSEIKHLLSDIALCIKDGSNPAFFSQLIDKVISNELQERDRETEEAWQEKNDNQ